MEAVRDDLERYFRHLRLKEFFLEEDQVEDINNTDTCTQFLPLSTWMPPKCRDVALEIYIKQFRRDVEHQLDNINKKCCHDNLPPQQKKALRELQHRSDIVTKPGDKGSAVVVLSKDDYIKDAERQLNNHAHYEKLHKYPILRYSLEIKKYVEFMFSKRTKNFLTPHHPQSSNGAPTKNISRFVLYFLQPCISTLSSYITDTTDFINRLRRLPTLQPGTLLVKLIVTLLYTNIPQEGGITACEQFLNLRDLLVPSTADLCHLI